MEFSGDLADEGGLAGTVAAQQAEHGTVRDGEIDAVVGQDAVAIALCEAPNVDGGGVRGRGSGSWLRQG